MTKPLIDQAVDRFLAWKLPEDFSPDCGISFTKPNHPTSWPIGTNLLDAIQAKGMLQHVALPMLARLAELEAAIREALDAPPGIRVTVILGNALNK